MSRLTNAQSPNLNCYYLLNARVTMMGSSAGSTFTTPPSTFAQQYNCSAPHALIGNVTRVTTTSYSSGGASINGILPISVSCCSNTQLALGLIGVSSETPGFSYSGTPVVLTTNTVTSPATFCSSTGASQNFPPFGSTSPSEDGGTFYLGLTRDNTGRFLLSATYDSPIGILSVSNIVLGTTWAEVWGSYSFTSSNGLTADGSTNNAALELTVTLAPPG